MIEIITETRPDAGGERYQLDINQTEQIVIKKTFAELLDIEKRKGSFTYAFTLPKTPRNVDYFGGFGDPSNVGVLWDPSFDAPVWLIEDTNLIVEGSLRLEQTNSDGTLYQVSISGLNFTIKNSLGDRLMSALNMSAWTYAPSDIINTWDRSIFGGHVVFPPHDFGFGYGLYKKQGDPAVLTLQDIKVDATAIILERLLPAFRLNELLRMMFDQAGLTLTGSWFSEPEVEEIYCQVDNPLSEYATQPPLPSTRIETAVNIEATASVVLWVQTDEFVDWDDDFHEYTAPVDGDFYWSGWTQWLDGIPAGTNIICDWEIDSGSGFVVVHSQSNAGFVYIVLNNHKFVMSAGDKLRQTIRYTGTPITKPILAYLPANHFTLNSVSNIGGDKDPSLFLQNYRQVDFLRAFMEAFNLVIWKPDNEEVRIDTYEYYILTYGSTKDWTSKLDVIRPPVIKPINAELRNPIFLSFKEADTVLNQDYINVVGYPYGAYREEADLPFAQPGAKPNDLFAPFPVQDIRSSDINADFPEFIIAKCYTDEDSIAYKPPGLQLGYFNGPRTVDAFKTKDTISDLADTRTAYPYMSPFRLYSADSWRVQADTLDLNYTWWSPPVEIVDTPSGEGLFNRYFREMLRDRYNQRQRVLELKFLLTSTDINGFHFADTIIITLNGTPISLRILEIKDYVPGGNKLTSVKAILTLLQ